MSESPMNPYGKLFKGEGQTKVEIGYFSEKNKDGLQDVLVKITGKAAHEEGIEGQVQKCTATKGPDNGINYEYVQDGKTFNRMCMRKGWGAETLELYVSNETINLQHDEKESPEVKPDHLLTAYEEANKAKAKKK